MTRLNLVLLLAVLASALYLVNVQYESRRLFTELDRAVAEAHRLDIESERLELEKRAQATPLRVERLAREKLRMRPATPAVTHYATYSGASDAPAAGRPASRATRETTGQVQ